jgi:hypothetical protein
MMMANEVAVFGELNENSGAGQVYLYSLLLQTLISTVRKSSPLA